MKETSQDKADRAIRRRWINVGEIVAIAGVIIAGLTFYESWSDRREAAAEKRIEHQAEASNATRVTLRATAEKGGDRLTLADAAHPAIASIDIDFPPSLAVARKTALLSPTIEADWFRSPLLKATDGGKDAIEGRLPVLVTTTLDDDGRTVDRAIYDVVFATEGRTFGGRHLTLKGVLLRQRLGRDATAARLDPLWAAEARRLAALKS